MAKTGNEIASTNTVRAVDGGLAIERRFTTPGTHPFDQIEWGAFIERWLRANHVTAARVLLIAGPSRWHPHANHRVELMRLNNA